VPGVIFGVWLWWRQRRTGEAGAAVRLRNPLDLKTAIKFAILYAVIAFLVKAAPQLGLAQSILPLSFVSGLTDMDAIALSMARNSPEPTALDLATRAVIVAGIANTLLKAGLAVALGSPGLRPRVAIVLGATAAVGVAWLLAH
ncbi:MAG TPA: DUF4010 domain-containing protein, partial [Opitutus sp.]|nr:DUF4010 domain-containing protein [Opitutus sp.]